jgi:hypothetical protein
LKSNVIYTYFNRRTLLENGNASVLLNAVNAPSVLSPYDADGNATVFPGGTLGNEMINPLAQIDNTYNNYNFKQISGNFGLDAFLKILLSLVIWDSSPPIVNQNLC